MASLLFAGNAGASVRRSSDEESHTVRQGQMLSTIAQQHGITLDALAAANGITDPDFVLAGRLLTVPLPGSGPADTYEVRAGDTLSEIALRVGASPGTLARLNDLSDPDHVRVGQRLQIVGTAPAKLPDSLRTRPERAGLVDDFQTWASTYEVPSDLLMALAYVESGWQSDVVSSAGAVGVGQLMPDTVELVRNVLLPGVTLDPLDAEDSVHMTARYLRYLRHRTGSWDDAVGAYFQGLAGLRRDGRRPATNAYIAAVSANRTLFST
jgi:LysM repeat protein